MTALSETDGAHFPERRSRTNTRKAHDFLCWQRYLAPPCRAVLVLAFLDFWLVWIDGLLLLPLWCPERF